MNRRYLKENEAGNIISNQIKMYVLYNITLPVVHEVDRQLMKFFAALVGDIS